MGATVLAFQGIGDRASVTFMLPMLVYLFVVVIGTEYNILMITRLREEAKLEVMTTARAVREVARRGGRALPGPVARVACRLG
jgi:uncharacterized membrane protein YdfJ with MMPL/SSD domain